MKNLKKILSLIAVGFVFVACHSNDDYDGDWSKNDAFAEVARTGSVSFVIGDVAYVGLGITDDSDECNDFYQFNGGWKSVDNFPGKARYGAVAFSDGKYGYVGLGFAANTNAVSTARVDEWFTDFYRFDPTQPIGHQWSQIANFPGYPRRFAVGFYTGGKGYVGTGKAYNTETKRDLGERKDFYSYDSASNTWTEIDSFGDPRQGAVAFKIDENVYIATGVAGSSFVNDFIKFSPTEGWSKLDPLKNIDTRSWDNAYNKIPRKDAVAFVLDTDRDVAKNQNKRAYIATGYSSSGMTYTVFEYNPYDTRGGRQGHWREITEVPTDLARQMAVGFSINNNAYITLGGSGVALSAKKTTYLFTPDVKDDDQNDN